jgi:hypothetical protein
LLTIRRLHAAAANIIILHTAAREFHASVLIRVAIHPLIVWRVQQRSPRIKRVGISFLPPVTDSAPKKRRFLLNEYSNYILFAVTDVHLNGVSHHHRQITFPLTFFFNE